MRKVIISAALTGVLPDRRHCEAIPYTPREIAKEARRAYEAGAAIAHIHAREDDGAPSSRPERYLEIMAAVWAECPIIISLSADAQVRPKEERIAHIARCKPDFASVQMGSMNLASYSERRKAFDHDHVLQNPFTHIGHFLEVMQEHGVRPQLECFDRGHIQSAAPFVDQGLLQGRLRFSLIMGLLGGIPATVPDLVSQVSALPPGALWQVIGMAHAQWPMVAAALAMGGDVRVGFEDNCYLSPGTLARSNGDLVAKAVRMARDVGREPATVDEARTILGL